jgi:glucose-1-phosphate cytidylyltransferase
MKVVLLCGGKGTRLREETELKPKPMVAVGTKPIVWHIMKTFAAQGFNEFVLCLGYKGDVIKRWFLNYETENADFTMTLGKRDHGVEFHSNHHEEGWKITLADTGEDAMTGARVRKVAKYLGDEPFFLTYGDGVSDVDVRALLKFHREHGKLATVTGVRPPGRFGELALDGDAVSSFQEKPESGGGFINGGFFVMEPGALSYLTTDDSCILEREPLEKMSHDGQLMMFRHQGFWQCVDTYRDLTLVNDLWSRGRAPWKLWK